MLPHLEQQFYASCNALAKVERDERAEEIIESILHAVTVKLSLIINGSKKRARALTRNRRLATPQNRDSSSYNNQEQLVLDTLNKLQENFVGIDIISSVTYEPKIFYNIEEYTQTLFRVIEDTAQLLWSLNFYSVVLNLKDGVKVTQSRVDRQIIAAIKNVSNSVEIIAKIIPIEEILTFRLGGKCLLLHYAAFSGNVDMVEYCLSLSSEQPLCAGMTPAFYAVSNSYLEADSITRILDCLRVHSSSRYDRDCLGRGLVHQATLAGNLAALAFMKGNGADLRAATAHRKSSCVHLACRQGYTQIALWLIDIGGLNPLSVDSRSRSPVYYGYLPADHRVHLIWEMSKRGILLPQQDMEALGWTGRVSKELLSIAFQQSLLAIEEMSMMVFELQDASEDDDLHDEGVEIEEEPRIVKSWGRRGGLRVKKKLQMGSRQRDPARIPRSNTHAKTEEFGGVAVRARNESLISFVNTFGADDEEAAQDLSPRNAPPSPRSPPIEQRTFAWCLKNRLQELEEFAETLYASENIRCWKAISLYEESPTEETCRQVFAPHLLADSPMLVNIRGRESSRLRALLEESSYQELAASYPNLFQNVKRELEKVMQLNLYPCYKAAHHE